MQEVIKQRMVGMGVLVGAAVLTTLAVIWLTRPTGGSGSGPARVYEVTPDGAEPVEAPATSDAAAQRASTPEPSEPERQPAKTPDPKPSAGQSSAVSPQAEPAGRPESGTDRQAKSGPEPESDTQPDASTKPASKSESAVADKHWVVQVGSFTDESNAMSLMRALSDDFAAFYAEGEVNGRTYYRVRVGPFADEGAADEAARRLQAGGRNAQVMRTQ